jgi:hypothetical protein
LFFGTLLFQAKGAYNDNEVVKMRRLIALVICAILLAGLVLFGLRDTAISVADIGTRDNQMTADQTEASNASASATNTIAMYTGDAE